MITNAEEVIVKLAALPENLQQEVIDYLDFLLSKYDLKSYEVKSVNPLRIGMMKGTFIMSDDFDAPLADFSEYIS